MCVWRGVFIWVNMLYISLVPRLLLRNKSLHGYETTRLAIHMHFHMVITIYVYINLYKTTAIQRKTYMYIYTTQR